MFDKIFAMPRGFVFQTHEELWRSIFRSPAPRIDPPENLSNSAMSRGNVYRETVNGHSARVFFAFRVVILPSHVIQRARYKTASIANVPAF